MTESELYQHELKPMFEKRGIFHRRIELPCFPDIYTSKNGVSVWIEMKTVNSKSRVIKPSWRPGQLAWIADHRRFGGGTTFLALNYCGKTYLLEPKNEYQQEELICQMKEYLTMLSRKQEETV